MRESDETSRNAGRRRRSTLDRSKLLSVRGSDTPIRSANCWPSSSAWPYASSTATGLALLCATMSTRPCCGAGSRTTIWRRKRCLRPLAVVKAFQTAQGEAQTHGAEPTGQEMNRGVVDKADGLTLFLCGDVMAGRGIDQVLPHPSDPRLFESNMRSATEYVRLAEEANGPLPRPIDFAYVWAMRRRNSTGDDRTRGSSTSKPL